ncbi:hypothetical protein D0863_14582 [Hortaea werneckii]|uniref:Uncharacterized protein n=1 Tax=Hortaea werneckii TaxID=91943 RepID=A0A3M7CIL9_HORWE|nr:hypothetical protein D0863_14582 [Hortaea werneckii]
MAPWTDVKGKRRDADAMVGGEWQIHGNDHLTADGAIERRASVATRWVLRRAGQSFRVLEKTHESHLEETLGYNSTRRATRKTPLPKCLSCDLPQSRPATSASCICRTNLHISGHLEPRSTQLHQDLQGPPSPVRVGADSELKVVGEYGLRNKREVWRVQLTLSKIRRAARQLLTLDEKDPKRLFEGNALIRRLVRVGVLDESRMKLDYVLALKVEDFLERRLQTCVYKLGLAKSIHHARVLIRQRHIRVGKQIVNVPSFIVRLDSQKHIDFALTSPFGGGRPGRVRRKKAKAAEKKDEGGDEGEEEEE